MNKEARGFIPQFKWGFLHPRYWLIWFGVLVLTLLALLPIRWRDPVLAKLGTQLGRKFKSPRKRAQANLQACFPDLAIDEREAILDQMFGLVLPITVLLVDITLKKSKVTINWHGEAHLIKAKAENTPVIFMVPHGWAIDLPAMLLAQKGYPMSGMFHNQSNPLVDWLWNSARKRFGGQLHARNDGVKPFIHSIRAGAWGYYLPDEDHGPEVSEFAPFFSTYKATLPLLGRLAKLSRAEVMPLFPVYDPKTSTFDIYIKAPLNFPEKMSAEEEARLLNQVVEELVSPNIEQYTWILRILKTRKEGDPSLYD